LPFNFPHFITFMSSFIIRIIINSDNSKMSSSFVNRDNKIPRLMTPTQYQHFKWRICNPPPPLKKRKLTRHRNFHYHHSLIYKHHVCVHAVWTQIAIRMIFDTLMEMRNCLSFYLDFQWALRDGIKCTISSDFLFYGNKV